MLLSLALTLWLEVHHVISLSILDSFTLHENVYCSSRSLGRYGRAHRTLEESALMCLIYDDCAHFEWHDINANEPLAITDRCDYAGYSGCIV
jgi:hypothetical protein